MHSFSFPKEMNRAMYYCITLKAEYMNLCSPTESKVLRGEQLITRAFAEWPGRVARSAYSKAGEPVLLYLAFTCAKSPSA